jgi:hypothetical protein
MFANIDLVLLVNARRIRQYLEMVQLAEFRQFKLLTSKIQNIQQPQLYLDEYSLCYDIPESRHNLC